MKKYKNEENYRKTKKGLFTQIYSQQKVVSKQRGHSEPSYTKKEFSEWLNSQELFHTIYDYWMKLGYQSTDRPSVDRINSKLGYSISNIQLMTWGENKEKGKTERASGDRNGNSRTVDSYSVKSTLRGSFRTTCVTRGWDFKDFIEIDSGEKTGKDKKYYYTKKEEK